MWQWQYWQRCGGLKKNSNKYITSDKYGNGNPTSGSGWVAVVPFNSRDPCGHFNTKHHTLYPQIAILFKTN
jgi:hypothetical protein